tara:strand:+ start:6576 stop:6848 length:273 start_codon:yes stop_codon:yes gene_type:complete
MRIYKAKIENEIHMIDDKCEVLLVMPLAETEAPENGTTCFSPDTLNDTYIEYSWSDCPTDYKYLERGMVYLSQREAEEHNGFIINFRKAV